MLKKSSGGGNTLKVTKLMFTVKKRQLVLLCEQVTKIPSFFFGKERDVEIFLY